MISSSSGRIPIKRETPPKLRSYQYPPAYSSVLSPVQCATRTPSGATCSAFYSFKRKKNRGPINSKKCNAAEFWQLPRLHVRLWRPAQPHCRAARQYNKRRVRTFEVSACFPFTTQILILSSIFIRYKILISAHDSCSQRHRSAESMQKRDVSDFHTYLKDATADFVAVNNAVVGVASQLNVTQELLRTGALATPQQASLTAAEALTLFNDYNKLKPQILTAMNNSAQRRDIIQSSSECHDISLPLIRFWVYCTLFFTGIQTKLPDNVKVLFRVTGDEMAAKIIEQVNSFKCPS